MPIKDDVFYISLAEDDRPYTIPKLLRHAMKSLRDTVRETPVYINELSVQEPYMANQGPSLRVSYIVRNKEMLTLRQDALDFRKEAQAAHKVKEYDFTISRSDTASLNMLEYRLPQSDNQDNSILLIEKLADFLESHKIEQVLDLIYHDFIDDDGIEHPFVRIYYMSE